MVYIIKRYILIKLKSIETQLIAHRKRHEIQKAYSQPSDNLFPTIILISKKILPPFIVIMGTLLLFAGIYWGGKSLIDFSNNNITKQEKKVVNKSVINKKLAKNTEHKEDKKITQDDIPIVSDDLLDSSMNKVSFSKALFEIEISEEISMVILANKASKKMYLLSYIDKKWIIKQEYPMAIGEHEGEKYIAGDKKTPEGLYFIVGRKEGNELSRIYGPLAYVLNYPNKKDRAEKRTGTGIWIHGTDPDSTPIQTRGCLELHNTNILKLGSILKTGIGTPVYIVTDSNLEDPAKCLDYVFLYKERKKLLNDYLTNRQAFVEIVNNWEISWEKQDIDEYEKFYYLDVFSGQGLNWRQWRKKKIRTFQAYKTIEINIEKLILTDFSESTAVLKFLQQYNSERFNVVNGKKLSFRRNKGQWKIAAESTFPPEELLL